MSHRSLARGRLRIAVGSRAPFDASLEVRVQCWLRRVARAIERRDTPQAAAGQGRPSGPPAAGG